jgi:hypothetical protein
MGGGGRGGLLTANTVQTACYNRVLLCDLWVTFFDKVYGVIKIKACFPVSYDSSQLNWISFPFQGNKGQTETRHKTLIHNDVFGFKNINSTAFLLCSNFGAYKISGFFVKPLRKSNISTVTYLPPIIPHGKIRLPLVGFNEIYMVYFLKKYAAKIQIRLQSYKISDRLPLQESQCMYIALSH